MKEVQVFKKTLLSVAVVAALGGYGSYSEAQININASLFDNETEVLDLKEIRDQLSEFENGDVGYSEIHGVLGLFDKYAAEAADADTTKLKALNAKLRKDLEAAAKTLFVWEEVEDDSGGGGKNKNNDEPETRVKERLPVVERTLSGLTEAEDSSEIDGAAYGLNEQLVRGDKETDGKYQARTQKHLKELQFLKLTSKQLKALVLVDKDVNVGSKKQPKIETRSVVPDRIVLKNMDLSDTSVRQAVLAKLASDLGDVISYQGDVLGFKTNVFEESGVHSGFQPGQVMPVIESMATGKGVDSAAAGRVVLTNQADAVHKGFGSTNKALEALVVQDGASARVVDGGAIYSTVVFIKDADELTGVGVKKGKTDKDEDVAENVFVDVIGVLPSETTVYEEYEEKGAKKQRAVQRIHTEMNIDGLKGGKFNAKSYESISIANAKVEVQELGFDHPVDSEQAVAHTRKLTIKDAEVVVAAGGKGIAGQDISLDNVKLHSAEVEKVEVQAAKKVNNKDVEAVVEEISYFKPVQVTGRNEMVEMEQSKDGFKTVQKAESKLADDTLTVGKGTVAYVDLKDIDKVSMTDAELHVKGMGSSAAPLKALDRTGKAILRDYSNAEEAMYLAKEVDVVLAKEQEIVKDIVGFKSFVLDGGHFEGSLTGYGADPKSGNKEKDAERFKGSSVELRSGVYRGGVVDTATPVTVTGDVTIKPDATELKALDLEETRKQKTAVYQKTVRKQAEFTNRLDVASKGNLIIHKTVVESETVGEGKKAKITTTVSPTVVARKGLNLDKGASLTVMLDLSDSSIDKVPYASVTGGVKLAGNNKLNIGLNKTDNKAAFQYIRKLHKDSKAGNAAKTTIAVIEADKFEGDFEAQDTGYAFLDVTKGTVAKKAGKQMYSADMQYNHKPLERLKKQGLSSNQAKMYVLMNEAAVGGAESDTALAMFTAMGSATTAAEAGALATEMLPNAALNYSVQQSAVTVRTKAVESISRHLSNSRTGINTGEMFESQGFWAEYIGSKGEMDNKDGVLGYESKINGVNLGLDAMVNDQTTVGFAFTMAKADITTNSSKSDVTANTYMGTLYTGWTMENYFFDTMFSYGRTKNELERTVSGAKYKAEADATVWGASFAAGYNYQMNQWTLQPRVEFNYMNVNMDDLDEKGGALTQKVAFSDYEVMELGAGLRVLGEFELEQGVLRPEFKLMGYHDFKDEKSKVTVTMADPSNSAEFEGLERDQNRVAAGMGVNFEMQNNLTLGLHYEHNWMGDYKANSLNASVRYDF